MRQLRMHGSPYGYRPGVVRCWLRSTSMYAEEGRLRLTLSYGYCRTPAGTVGVSGDSPRSWKYGFCCGGVEFGMFSFWLFGICRCGVWTWLLMDLWKSCFWGCGEVREEGQARGWTWSKWRRRRGGASSISISTSSVFLEIRMLRL